jgi:hypothetical protein
VTNGPGADTPRPSTLQLPEPASVAEDPFWVMQGAGALPLAFLLLGALDAVRYAVAGPTPFERSINIDVLYAAGFLRLASWWPVRLWSAAA